MDEIEVSEMTQEQFEEALLELGWKVADFCRLAGVHRNTVSRWVNNKGDIPLWVSRFLAMAKEIKRLSKLIEPAK
jgi:transcriptional regulator with XRE-family HTH domain